MGCERCKGREGHDSNSRVQVGGRVYWSEGEGGEGNNGGVDGRGSRSVEEGRLLQDCRCAQLEAEAETCNTRPKGRQPIHERALRLQSQASIKDCEGTSYEEAQDAGELMLPSPARSLSSALSLGRLRSRWAVSLGQGDALYFRSATPSSTGGSQA